MMELAIWSAAMAVLMIFRRPDQAFWAWMASALGLLRGGSPGLLVVTGMLSALMWLQSRDATRADPGLRESLIRFWQEVGVLLSAGLGFLPAVETAAGAEPVLAPLIAQAARKIAESPHAAPSNPGLPGLDGEVTLLMLQHGYLHGMNAGQVQAEVQHMEARLAYEREARKRRDPLWMTVLPALLLLNVLWIFVAPMLAMASHSWLKL
ncbi:hypothetical protein [Sulfobacillus harzensis]|uniref:Type II secretion system protein GspF domain-containing protein n=1 Tax=Sulfobacillus harzensis TaxID=2729629 RepID=A0A7Y0L815_9FIRM|nr:hypothetical protein [Sulfobacillus harzensis]NMP24891.1 hypothetical protein [Sulfobacillus harzensis]